MVAEDQQHIIISDPFLLRILEDSILRSLDGFGESDAAEQWTSEQDPEDLDRSLREQRRKNLPRSLLDSRQRRGMNWLLRNCHKIPQAQCAAGADQRELDEAHSCQAHLLRGSSSSALALFASIVGDHDCIAGSLPHRCASHQFIPALDPFSFSDRHGAAVLKQRERGELPDQPRVDGLIRGLDLLWASVQVDVTASASTSSTSSPRGATLARSQLQNSSCLCLERPWSRQLETNEVIQHPSKSSSAPRRAPLCEPPPPPPPPPAAAESRWSCTSSALAAAHEIVAQLEVRERQPRWQLV
eukprot:CAMPEP_0171521592 /NCGR_PEP_ID=MMETSP0959-20130129/7218_1 /TAXON_ID=87120 /ORGANISM="Aurantiochytrium limacinum, Strain ATCCMYA-1381" /LENGTH=299 /DNA_ID=CAMNT_0012061511 /DNA_START=647 /DNA_END=1547 /DNA_ORIENTATION=-